MPPRRSRPCRLSLPLWAWLLGASLVLTACGGGAPPAADSSPATTTPAAPERGSLRSAPAAVDSLTAAEIDTRSQAAGLSTLAGTARCDVRVVALDYHTPHPDGDIGPATGVLLLPGGACTGPAPLLAYARGTEVNRQRTLARAGDAETFLLLALYAAQGYAVVASDYLGYAGSTLDYHPYLHADTEASTVIDAIRAARRAATQLQAPLSGRVMLAGYSQGGHASAAAQREGERTHAEELGIVAAAHLSAPVNLSGGLRQGTVIAGYQYFIPMMVTAWNRIHGDIYSDVNTVFRPPYAAGIEDLLPGEGTTLSSLLVSGQLPGGQGETPTQVRDALVQADFLLDVERNDTNGLYVNAQRNDLLDWTPVAPVLLCGGSGDPTVLHAVNQATLAARWASQGITNMRSVDVDASVRALYGVAGQAPTDPTTPAFATYYGNYHARYVPPLCHAQARAFFDTLR